MAIASAFVATDFAVGFALGVRSIVIFSTS
jgi:hypothetical protein